jgi:hypothetical protein
MKVLFAVLAAVLAVTGARADMCGLAPFTYNVSAGQTTWILAFNTLSRNITGTCWELQTHVLQEVDAFLGCAPKDFSRESDAADIIKLADAPLGYYDKTDTISCPIVGYFFIFVTARKDVQLKYQGTATFGGVVGKAVPRSAAVAHRPSTVAKHALTANYSYCDQSQYDQKVAGNSSDWLIRWNDQGTNFSLTCLQVVTATEANVHLGIACSSNEDGTDAVFLVPLFTNYIASGAPAVDVTCPFSGYFYLVAAVNSFNDVHLKFNARGTVGATGAKTTAHRRH